MKLSIVMIVKNEESCLETCLETVKDADEIIIVDTGSKDKTVEIAEKYGKVFYYEWNDNFAEARNFAKSKATGDWILSIDADEKLLNTIEQVKKIAEQAEADGVKAINVNQVSGSQSNKFPRLFKNCEEVCWIGAIHNYLSISGKADSNLKIEYGYSPAHNLDPDRTLRILKKEVEKGGKKRELYYLGREYWYRKDYENAIYWFEEYISVSTFLAEKADAYLYLARCYWQTGRGEKARVKCLMALNINANFKEALELMAEMSWEHNAKTWRKFAEIATNENVLFVRSKGYGKKILEKNINDAEHYNEYWRKRNFKIDYSEPLRMKTLMDKFTGGRFLDAGCGLAPLCEMALEKSSEVWGTDISDELIKNLQTQFPNINYKVGDVRKMEFEDNYFDYLATAEVLEHMENPEDVLKEMVRVVKPGGMLAISVPNDDNGGYAIDWHIWSFNREGFKQLLSKYGTASVEWITENNHRYGHLIGYLIKK